MKLILFFFLNNFNLKYLKAQVLTGKKKYFQISKANDKTNEHDFDLISLSICLFVAPLGHVHTTFASGISTGIDCIITRWLHGVPVGYPCLNICMQA